MTTVYLLLGGILLVSLFIAWKLITGKQPESDGLRSLIEKLQSDIGEARMKDREHLQARIDHVSSLMQKNIEGSSKDMREQMRQSTDIIKQVTEKLTKLDETNKQVVNFSSQLEDLQRILKQPKGKGVIGEYWLDTMLSHVLQPDQFKIQYKFSNGEIVDAAVFFQDKIIPIDSKFSSEKYLAIDKERDAAKREKLEEEFKKDLKARIDETAKYIRPGEGTTDYAFMFIPAEGIYYDLLVQKVGSLKINQINLIQYAHGRRVLIVSPNTFFAFLQTVIEGMRAYRMQESVQEILLRIEQLGKHLNAYDSFMQKMGKNLTTTVGAYNDAYKEFRKVDKDVFKLTEEKAGGTIEIMEVDKPTAHLDAAFEKASEKQIVSSASR